jgi:ATP-dependent DNA ligase
MSACWRAGPRVSSSTRSSAARSAPDLFRAASDVGLEGLVSKRRDRPGKGSKHWVKG